MIPRVVVFDLDKTLAASKQAITDDMADLLTWLLAYTSIAVTSGGKLEQLEQQITERMTQAPDFLNFYLLPTSGAALYASIQDSWTKIYAEELSIEEVVRIEKIMETAIQETNVIDLSMEPFGDRIEFRGAQVTLSALGQQAPIDQKEAWDPDGSKRIALRDAIAKQLPEYDVKRGGSTSIDVTRKGINKAYGVRKLSDYLKIPISDMMYVGDALMPGGNDEVVKETGIPTHEVTNPDDTAAYVQSLLDEAEK
jgi:phosphomannomutase